MKLHISHLDIVLISCLKNLYSHMAYLGNVTDGIIQAGFGKLESNGEGCGSGILANASYLQREALVLSRMQCVIQDIKE